MKFLAVLFVLSLFSYMIHGTFLSTNNNNFEQKLERFRQQLRDNRGCDAMINSCGDKGECCDEHDACYRTNGCTARSWLTMVYDWDACAGCNLRVMRCIATRNPGMSSCCQREDCGQHWK